MLKLWQASPPMLTSYAKATEVKKLWRAGEAQSRAVTSDFILRSRSSAIPD